MTTGCRDGRACPANGGLYRPTPGKARANV
jgi:hypothetical protein